MEKTFRSNKFKKCLKNIELYYISMASFQAFNSMMQEFLDELIQTIPEEKSLKLENTKFQTLKKSNPKKVCEAFMTGIGPYSEQISQRNEETFTNSDIEFLRKINIEKWWPKISDNTKDAIWQYLNTLIMLGTTITSISPDMLQTIENVAEQCASSMGDSDNSQPNIGNLFPSLQSMMGNMSNQNFKNN